jgi:alkylhydroperoxidase family enzyme
MAEARQHFSDSEIIEITSVISLYGFLNRCNSILATELEPLPASFFESLNAN